MEKHQVIIVGGGPAGATCAKALMEDGIDVLIIEKDGLPQHKTCSGVLFGQTQVLLEKFFGGLPPEDVYCRPKTIAAADIREWDREQGFIPYVWELPKDGQVFPAQYLNIWRSRFDHWLLKQSGAPFHQNCALKGYSVEGAQVHIEVYHKDRIQVDPGDTDLAMARQALCCDYLIGADGGASRVRMIHDPDWAAQSPQMVVYQAYFPLKDPGSLSPQNWHVFFEPGIGEILSSVHPKDDFLTLCVGGFKGRSLNQSMQDLVQFLSDNFQVKLGEAERVEGCLLRQAPPNLGRGRVLLTGEAAGFMYLNGEGISAAMDAAYRAGKAVSRAIREGGDAAERYQSEAADILAHMDQCMQQLHFLTVAP